MRKILLISLFALVSNIVFGQALKTIQEIQTPIDLSTCNDSSSLVGDQVKVRGVVIMDVGLTWNNANGRNLFIQVGDTGYSAIQVRQSSSTLQTGIGSLLAGDSVEIIGKIEEFAGHTQLNPDVVQTMDQVLGSGTVKMKSFADLSLFNDGSRGNRLATGEPWEGQFVEFAGPLTVTFVDLFAGGTRCSFDVVDATGNKMNVTDLFACQRLATNGGTFVAPTVGDIYSSLKGVIVHSKNIDTTITSGCTLNGRGYSLAPFNDSHYQKSVAAPSIVIQSRNPITPTTSQSTNITVQITDDGTVTSAELLYAVGVSNTTYVTLTPASTSGNVYTFTIPNTAYSEGDFVKYYVRATDNQSNVANVPNVPANSDPVFFRVRDNGTQIVDIQYTPYTNGTSGYNNLEVTVTGVVTASANTNGDGDLGYIYIQQEGQQAWAGITLLGNSQLSTLQRGDKVTVTGTVKENFGFTRLENITSVTTNGTGTITPVKLAPATFSTYDFATNEMYEGMLVTLAAGSGQLFVVDDNADGATPPGFAEYRVGTDTFDPNSGCRILAGRVTSTSLSSLYVSYVNDPSWATTDGTMMVAVKQVQVGTAMDSVSGIITYTFNNMKLLPRNNNDFYNVSGLVGVAKQAEKDANVLRMFPNPAANTITIAGVEKSAVVTIANTLGAVVKTTSINNVNSNVSIADMHSGTYFVKVTSAEGVLMQTKLTVIK